MCLRIRSYVAGVPQHVQWLQAIDDVEDAVDERLSLAIGEGPERLLAAEMLVAIGVAARTSQRTFLGCLNGEVWISVDKLSRCGLCEGPHLP